MRRWKTIGLCAALEVMVIVCVSLANLYPGPLHYFLFYNLLYGILFSFLVPLFLLRGKGCIGDYIGFKVPGKRQLAVLLAAVAVSVGGQLIPVAAGGGRPQWSVLPMGVVPLVMTTFFEEFLFRGFVQNRVGEEYGTLLAILLSGLLFSLYHLGYPGFRTFGDLLLLFAVGIGFAAVYQVSGNNFIVAYFVNLPNALVTYMLKFGQFPEMKGSSTAAAIVTLLLVLMLRPRSASGENI